MPEQGGLVVAPAPDAPGPAPRRSAPTAVADLVAAPPGLGLYAGLSVIVVIAWRAMASPTWTSEFSRSSGVAGWLIVAAVIVYVVKLCFSIARHPRRARRGFDLARWIGAPLIVVGLFAAVQSNLRLRLEGDERVTDPAKVEVIMREAITVAIETVPGLDSSSLSGSWAPCGTTGKASAQMNAFGGVVSTSQFAATMRLLTDRWSSIATTHGWTIYGPDPDDATDTPRLEGRGYEIEVQPSGGFIHWAPGHVPTDPPIQVAVEARGPCVEHAIGPIS